MSDAPSRIERVAPIALLGSLLLAAGAAGIALTPPPAHSQTIELVGDFPTTSASWGATTNASSAVDDMALRLVAVGSGQFGICSGILGGVEGGWSVSASANLDASDARTSSPTTTLDFLDAGFASLGDAAGSGAPEGTTYVRFCVRATAAEAGAELVILGATISATAPITATATSTATATATSTATAASTATASTTATGSATPTAASSPTAIAPATSVATPGPTRASTRPAASPTSTAPPGEGLRNADFELGGSATPLHWDVRRGSATTAIVAAGTGRSALITSRRSTSWIEQLVPAASGRWFEATAHLAAIEGVSAGWVRIAWYATSDGSGGQTSTDDSPSVEGSGGAWTTVSTGAVQAPEGTLSARVRILVRPADDTALLAADDVTFEETLPPSAPTSAATPATTSGGTTEPTPASNAATPAATLAASAGAPSTGSTAADSPLADGPRVAATPASSGPVELVRITEVLADPEVPGNDAGFEWVELTNFGAAPVWLAGASLEDRSGRTEFQLSLEAGATLVVAAPDATFEAGIEVLRVERIGNGLRNDGDVVRLIAPDGAALDEVRWGDVEEAELRPGSGESVQRWFDDAAHLLDERAGAPSPGRRTEAPAVESPLIAEPDATSVERAPAVDVTTTTEASPTAMPVAFRVGGRAANDPLWLVLFTLAGGALGGLGLYRGLEIWRGRGR